MLNRRKRASRRKKVPPLSIELLEERRLLSAAVLGGGGVLTFPLPLPPSREPAAAVFALPSPTVPPGVSGAGLNPAPVVQQSLGSGSASPAALSIDPVTKLLAQPKAVLDGAGSAGVTDAVKKLAGPASTDPVPSISLGTGPVPVAGPVSFDGTAPKNTSLAPPSALLLNVVESSPVPQISSTVRAESTSSASDTSSAAAVTTQLSINGVLSAALTGNANTNLTGQQPGVAGVVPDVGKDGSSGPAGAPIAIALGQLSGAGQITTGDEGASTAGRLPELTPAPNGDSSVPLGTELLFVSLGTSSGQGILPPNGAGGNGPTSLPTTAADLSPSPARPGADVFLPSLAALDAFLSGAPAAEFTASPLSQGDAAAEDTRTALALLFVQLDVAPAVESGSGGAATPAGGASRGVTPGMAAPALAVPPSTGGAGEDVLEVETLTPQALATLADGGASDVSGLGRAVRRFLGQLGALRQEVGALLAGLGPYAWLVGLALGAGAYAVYRRRARRQAGPPGLTGDDEAAALLWTPALAAYRPEEGA